MAFRNQVSTFVQSISDDLWRVPPMNQLVWLKYFKDLKLDYGFLSWLVTHFNPNTMVFRFEDSEVTPTYEEMCAVTDHHPDQDETPALPPGPSRLQVEVERLRTRLEVEGIPLDSSDEDEDGSSSNEAHRLHLLRLLLVRVVGGDSPAPHLSHFGHF
ncbi:hypothetical protein JCGZ_22076 [Jatropha curcas]|uniref:Aminotransferase-like plant mobile domain-containing protein n=1 Tax=Jatropha curcas TaxID=180498 RepID=A0A067JWB2_JATCU|nr:hypothetical protein JCGZ_22076 [Jatropha curcas]